MNLKVISNSTSSILFFMYQKNNSHTVVFIERLVLLLLLLSHDQIVQIKVFSGALYSFRRSCRAYVRSLPLSFTAKSLFIRIHTYTHTLYIYADELTIIIIEMLFVRCFIYSLSLFLFPLHFRLLQFVVFIWVFDTDFILAEKLWTKTKTMYVLSHCAAYTRCLKR